MANHPKADPADVALASSVIAELARAMRWHDERRALMKDRMALAMLDAQSKHVELATMADASGYSAGNIRLELARARKMAPADV